MYLYNRISVTRWLDYLSNIDPFKTMKIYPIVWRFAKSGHTEQNEKI